RSIHNSFRRSERTAGSPAQICRCLLRHSSSRLLVPCQVLPAGSTGSASFLHLLQLCSGDRSILVFWLCRCATPPPMVAGKALPNPRCTSVSAAICGARRTGANLLLARRRLSHLDRPPGYVPAFELGQTG